MLQVDLYRSYFYAHWFFFETKDTLILNSSAVPLCPRHPSPELEYFVRDSDASIIVTTSDLTHKIKPIISGQQVCFQWLKEINHLKYPFDILFQNKFVVIEIRNSPTTVKHIVLCTVCCHKKWSIHPYVFFAIGISPGRGAK